VVISNGRKPRNSCAVAGWMFPWWHLLPVRSLDSSDSKGWSGLNCELNATFAVTLPTLSRSARHSSSLWLRLTLVHWRLFPSVPAASRFSMSARPSPTTTVSRAMSDFDDNIAKVLRGEEVTFPAKQLMKILAESEKLPHGEEWSVVPDGGKLKVKRKENLQDSP
jgi:hypothetical protein